MSNLSTKEAVHAFFLKVSMWNVFPYQLHWACIPLPHNWPMDCSLMSHPEICKNPSYFKLGYITPDSCPWPLNLEAQTWKGCQACGLAEWSLSLCICTYFTQLMFQFSVTCPWLNLNQTDLSCYYTATDVQIHFSASFSHRQKKKQLIRTSWLPDIANQERQKC